MALDRTWYNALIDDDGSNTVGTVWGKDDIKNLLDSVDAEFTAQLTPFTWTPYIGSAGGGGATYVLQSGLGLKAGKLVAVTGRVILASKGSLVAGQATMVGFPYVPSVVTYQGGLIFPGAAGLIVAVSSLGAYFVSGSPTANLTYFPAAGATAAAGLDTTQIGATADFIFAGLYRID